MLRDDFDDILRDYGFNVLVVRQNTKLRCSCWDEKNQETSRACPVCFGLGTVPIIEKHTTRSRIEAIPQTLPRAMQDVNVGFMLSGGRAYWFRYDVPIHVRDLVVEVDWGTDGKPIYNQGMISEVNFISQMKFEKGEIAYVKAFVEDQPVLRDVRGIRIVQSQGIVNYELVGRG